MTTFVVFFLRCPTCKSEELVLVQFEGSRSVYWMAPLHIGLSHDLARMEIFDVRVAR